MGIADMIAELPGPDRNSVDMSAHWGEGAMVFSTPLTARDITRISRKHKNFMQSPSMEAMVDLLIFKAEEENGDKAFTIGNKPMLMGLDLAVLTEVFELIGSIDPEDIEKN